MTGDELTCWHCGAGAMPKHFKFCYLCGHAVAPEAGPAKPVLRDVGFYIEDGKLYFAD